MRFFNHFFVAEHIISVMELRQFVDVLEQTFFSYEEFLEGYIVAFDYSLDIFMLMFVQI